MTEYAIFEAGDIELQSGERLPGAKLAYATYGALSAAKDNAVLMPTYYTGSHESNEAFFGAGRALDPARHFIVSINLMGNGLSSSPSNTPAPDDGPRFPKVTLWDNVACQHRLLAEVFGIARLRLVTGWSMGGCQSYQWAAQYPDMVDAILPFCASAKTSPHNIVFLEGVKAALCADGDWNGGDYTAPPLRGLKAFGRVYAGWAYSQTFYRERLHRTLGFETFEDLLRDWEADHLTWDANDLLAMLWAWQQGDISANDLYGGDFPRALGAIRARAVVMPCTHDLYFPPEDNAYEVSRMTNAELRPFDSAWGHLVPRSGSATAFDQSYDHAVAKLLSA